MPGPFEGSLTELAVKPLKPPFSEPKECSRLPFR
jgi:hypothetical protein